MIGRSLSSRLALLQQAVTITVVVVFAASALWITQRTLAREERALLRETAARLAESVDREFGEEGDLARAVASVMEEEPATGMRIDIFDPAGRLLVSSQRATAGRPGESGGHQEVSVAAACGVKVTASISGRLRHASMTALGRALLITALPLLVLTMFLSRLITRRALRPLAEMGRRAHEASAEEAVLTIGAATGLAEIDELREAFDRLLGRLNELLNSERRFTADASHELRTPLTVLLGELESALARPDLPAEARAGLTRAAEQARTMRDLVEALLLLRRAGPGESGEQGGFELVNLADLVRESAAEAAARNPARSSDLTLSAPDEVLISGQPALLASAVRNILDNAIKFTAPGEAIHLEVEGAETATIVVDDAGPGIPASERERVFDPFYRTTEARAERTGLGLGLPILRQVARVHGGEVSIEDSPLSGARVLLRLPVWRGGQGPKPGGHTKAPSGYDQAPR